MRLSIVVPFFDEEENAASVLNEIVEVLGKLNYDYEIIAIDDASKDNTLKILQGFLQKVKNFRIISHRHNLGQGICLWEGMRIASGEVIITLDGDGQNDFRDVPKMLPLLKEYDAVLGQRIRRLDPFLKLIGTKVGYFFRQVFLNDNVLDTACGLKLIKKNVIQYFLPIRNFFLFIPFMLKLAGVPFVTIEVNHRPRLKGRSKYRFLRLYFLAYAFDLGFMWCYKRRSIFRQLQKNG